MPKKKLPYKPGDLFAVPLRCGGFAVGLTARIDGKGTVLGYFFGPRRDEPPTTDDVRELLARDSIEVAMFGDLGLIEGRWPVIAPLPRWDPARWPVPDFGRIDVVTGKRAWRVRYQDPSLKWLSDEACDIGEARALPRDGLMGAGAVEKWLSHLLSGNQSQRDSTRSTTPTLA